MTFEWIKLISSTRSNAAFSFYIYNKIYAVPWTWNFLQENYEFQSSILEMYVFYVLSINYISVMSFFLFFSNVFLILITFLLLILYLNLSYNIVSSVFSFVIFIFYLSSPFPILLSFSIFPLSDFWTVHFPKINLATVPKFSLISRKWVNRIGSKKTSWN